MSDDVMDGNPTLPAWMDVELAADEPAPVADVFAIPEATRRRPDFAGGEPVVLSDGQTWFVPRPRARFGLDDGGKGLTKVLSFAHSNGKFSIDLSFQRISDERDAARKALTAKPEEPEFVRVVEAELRLAHALLLRNYDLTHEELSGLVLMSWTEEDALRDAFLQIAEGVAPKPPGESSV